MTKQIIGLGGPRASGKSTIAQLLGNDHNFEQFAFSDVLRDIAKISCPDRIDDRQYLSDIGHLLRTYVPDFLLKAMDYKINSTKENVVIEDIRFPQELAYCRKRGIPTIYLSVEPQEQLSRLQKREGCDLQVAKELIDMVDESRLGPDDGWTDVLMSTGDFSHLAARIALFYNSTS